MRATVVGGGGLRLSRELAAMQSCKSTELQGALHTLAHMDAQLSPNYRSKRPIRLPRCPAEMNRNGEGLRYPYCTSMYVMH
jgi:hypothetical protein